jgi:hypothetical protein
MDHFKVLKRAWEMTWRYRVLWVFGILLALTTSQGGGNGGPQYSLNGNNLASWGGPGFFPLEAPPSEVMAQIVGALIAVGLALACLFLVLIVVATVVRYVAETALIRLVYDHEETGEKRSVGQGFRMGWSRSALRLFLIDLLIGVPLVLAFILLFLLALAPLLLWATDSDAAGAVGTVISVGLIFLFILLAIAVAIVVTLLMRFFHRACVLEELGVIEAIKRGFNLVRDHLSDVAVMWLIMVGVGIGLALAMIVIVILLLLLAAVLAGVPALLAGGLANLAFEGVVPWIVGAAVGIPIFLLVMVVPTLFLGGLIEVFKSGVWTLTYREVRALESVEPEADAAGAS